MIRVARLIKLSTTNDDQLADGTDASIAEIPVAQSKPSAWLGDTGVDLRAPVPPTPAAVDRVATLSYLRQQWSVGLPLLMADMLAIGLAIMTGLVVTGAMGLRINHGPAFCFCCLPAYALCLWSAGLYPGIGWHPARELRQLCRATLGASVAIVFGLAMLINWSSPYVLSMPIAFVILLPLLPVCRAGAKSLMQSGEVGVPFFFLGKRADVMRVYRDMNRFGWTMLRPVGRFTESDDDSDSWSEVQAHDDEFEWRFEQKATYRGTAENIAEDASREHVYWLFVVSDDSEATLARHPSLFAAFPELVCTGPARSRLSAANSLVSCGLTSGVRFEEPLLLPWPRLVKRFLDIVVSAGALIVLSPLLLAIAALIKATGPGPVFFSHQRLGRAGVEFDAWKFRSMVPNASQVLAEYLDVHPELLSEWNRDHKLKNDPRITWIGSLLRRTSLDELPQLWNVLVGEMSLVGPRPIVREEIDKYGATYHDYLRVTPGITGLWQVSGRNNTTYSERLMYDEFYVRHWSPWLDIYILARTFKTVVLCEGAY